MSVVEKRRSPKSGPVMMSDPLATFELQDKSRIFTVTSGKGGTGKTVSVISLALSLRKLGKKVLIVDGDMGLANVDILLGLKVRYHLEDVLTGSQSLQDVVLEGPDGICLIPGGSGISSLSNLSYVQQEFLREQLKGIQKSFDIVLLDTGAGINDNVLHLNHLAHKRILVTTPEPHAMADSYALMKVLLHKKGVRRFELIVNMSKNADEALSCAQRLKKTAEQFLCADINLLGFVPSDVYLGRAVLKRTLGDSSGRLRSLSGQAFHQIALRLMQQADDDPGFSADQFWDEILNRPEQERAFMAFTS